MISTLRDSLHEVVHNSGISIKELADELGISYSYLANAANPNLEDFNFQLKHLLPLTRRTGNFAVLDYIENTLDRIPITLPVVNPNVSELHNKLFKTIENFGVLAKDSAKALDDNLVTIREARLLERDTFDLIRKALLFLHDVQRAARQG